MDAFAVRFIIAVCAFFLLEKLVGFAIKKPEHAEVFTFILLLACIVFAIWGGLIFPFK